VKGILDNFNPLPLSIHFGTRVMMFVDGENIAIRCKDLFQSQPPLNHVLYIPDVAVWSKHANLDHSPTCQILRRHYYTSYTGDEDKIEGIKDQLKDFGIHHPCVFKKPKGGPAKRVDITLTTDMLGHAHRQNYDVAILVTGDQDYVPLVEAVKSEGRRVVLWALKSGLSKALERAVDHCFDLGYFLTTSPDDLKGRSLYASP
jgi:uncharacterized LabA/DUF88 family protein